ncbi:MAG: hypothetical protein GY715_17330 [Planctomycetes bacterium]|nr:hypothetical protein [Planctomycetota bacterium]
MLVIVMPEHDPDNASGEFVSEPITPVVGTFTTELMTRGLAALPGAFTWRDRRYEIVECLEHSKQSSPEGYTTDGERYLRRQRFRVRLDTGQEAVIYVERQSRPGVSRKTAKKRWFLFTITSGKASGGG